MNGRMPKLWPRAGASILLATVLFMASASPAMAARNYFKTYGADVMTGGWFGSACGSNPNYQTGGTGGDTAGIFAYARSQSTAPAGNVLGGASSQYGAFALGNIEGPAAFAGTPQYGFYSGGSQSYNGSPTSIPRNTLSFANYNYPSSADWGGNFEGSANQGFCIPDYYNNKRISPATWSCAFTCSNGQYQAALDGGCAVSGTCTYVNLTPSANVSIAAGKAITIFASGNVYISHNITYAAHNADNVPKFALVVLGSIYINPAVTQLDGLYIAQPANPNTSGRMNSDSGNIFSCHASDYYGFGADHLAPYSWFPNTYCPSTYLTVNGALIAKQVNLLRAVNNIIGACLSEDSLTGAACAGGHLPAEKIVYTPDMIINGGFFNQPTGSYKIDSLISLPPAF